MYTGNLPPPLISKYATDAGEGTSSVLDKSVINSKYLREMVSFVHMCTLITA